jgi:methionyl-tRNA formyltransferase
MNVYLTGQKYFGQEVYKLIRILGHSVIGVSSPAWGNEKLSLANAGDNDRYDRLRAIAELHGTPWLEAGKLRADTIPPNVDLIIAAHSHDFISRATRNRTTLGAIGYHPSLLPLHRGRDAVRWVIKLRERITGGTVFWLNETLDGGPIAAQEHVFIRPEWDAMDLWREALQPLGLKLMAQTLKAIDGGLLVRVPQEPKLATWEPSLEPPALYRPDLPQIGGAWDGYRVMTTMAEWDGMPIAM